MMKLWDVFIGAENHHNYRNKGWESRESSASGPGGSEPQTEGTLASPGGERNCRWMFCQTGPNQRFWFCWGKTNVILRTFKHLQERWSLNSTVWPKTAPRKWTQTLIIITATLTEFDGYKVSFVFHLIQKLKFIKFNKSFLSIKFWSFQSELF